MIKYNREIKPKISELDSLIQVKEGNKDIKRSLLDMCLSGWENSIGPKYMHIDEIKKIIDAIHQNISHNNEK